MKNILERKGDSSATLKGSGFLTGYRMRIWEIEEGREFRAIDHPVYDENFIFKFINKIIYVRTDRRTNYFHTFNISYNQAVTIDFEYLPEKKYYLKLKPEMRWYDCETRHYLNYDDEDTKEFFLSDVTGCEGIRNQFTEKEIEELIPEKWLLVCDRIEVENE